jgi:hypothetical protein
MHRKNPPQVQYNNHHNQQQQQQQQTRQMQDYPQQLLVDYHPNGPFPKLYENSGRYLDMAREGYAQFPIKRVLVHDPEPTQNYFKYIITTTSTPPTGTTATTTQPTTTTTLASTTASG